MANSHRLVSTLRRSRAGLGLSGGDSVYRASKTRGCRPAPWSRYQPGGIYAIMVSACGSITIGIDAALDVAFRWLQPKLLVLDSAGRDSQRIDENHAAAVAELLRISQ